MSARLLVALALVGISGCMSWNQRGFEFNADEMRKAEINKGARFGISAVNSALIDAGCSSPKCPQLPDIIGAEVKRYGICPNGVEILDHMTVRGYVNISARCKG